jgi:hypothetical protein
LNSLRPLDEPKKLKEKFDAIFDATKYNKASDGLSKLIKKRNESTFSNSCHSNKLILKYLFPPFRCEA